jgi:hypothetical protein
MVKVECFEKLAFLTLLMQEGHSHVTVHILKPYKINSGKIIIKMKGSIQSVLDFTKHSSLL